jgi:putative ABC transport system permease protein
VSLRDIRIPGIRRELRIARAETIDREIDDELRFHFELRAEQLMRQGLAADEARRRTLQEFGDVAASRCELSRIDHRRLGSERREEIAMSFREDLRYAARGLLRRPSLLLVTTATLSLGIAANAVMFGVVNQLLLEPPAHIANASDVKRINFRDVGKGEVSIGSVTTYMVLTALRTGTPAFSDLAAVGFVSSYTLGRGQDAQNIAVQMVSGNFFRLLGPRPHLGRFLVDGDDRIPKGDPVTVLSYGAWQQHFGGDSSVIGRVVPLQNKPFTIVGVAPKGFTGIDRQKIDAWVPVSAVADDALGRNWHDTPDNWWAQIIGRVRPEQSPRLAAEQATMAYRGVIRGWGDDQRDSTSSIVLSSIIGTRSPDGLSRESKVSLWLLGVSGIVLLIACSNVANLLVARTMERRRELAVRIALGVSRSRLIRMLLAEAALLSAIAAVAAIAIGVWGSRLVQSVLLPQIVWSDSILDLRVLGFTMGAAVLCMLLAGLVPALQGSRTDVAEALKSSARQVAGGRGRIRFALLLTQAALSMVLLIGAGLFVRSLRNVASRDIGVDRERVLRVTMPLSRFGFDSGQITALYRQGADRVRSIPGVSHVALAGLSYPLGGASSQGFSIPGKQRVRFDLGGPYNSVITPGFFETMGSRIVLGRDFTPSEMEHGARVIIVNEALAKGYWPSESPIGKCATFGDDSACSRIVGVVSTMLQFQVVRDERALVYAPFTHPGVDAPLPGVMVVRVTKANPAIVSLVRREIQALAPTMPYVQIKSYGELLAPQLQPWRLGATMFTLFGIIAVVIAAIGLYSVLAYWVSQRTHEIGIRMALGAQRSDVIRLVAAQSSRAVIAGLLIAVPIALLASRWIAEMLYETSPRDPLVYAGAAMVLALATAVATIVPARRSTAVDPAQAIRTD